eukprot:TRINITY_DN18637_c0_g1_i1.p1 TRINITY_DN18637_c0_g1~~TRINITY_DN18637_c0_g1_i1.p1  ORF type:complete len:559 (+),score=104.73 TRINITY_DN18637_c0_g1_i1:65-1741(+)
MTKYGLYTILVLPALLAGAKESEADIMEELRALKAEIAQAQENLKVSGDHMSSLLSEERAHHERLLTASNTNKTWLTKAVWEEETSNLHGAMDTLWLTLCGAIVMLMHSGFAMLETGLCRAKNAQSVLMKNLINVCVGTFGWWIFGWGFAYGSTVYPTGATVNGKLDNGFIGHDQFAASGFFSDASSGKIQFLGGRDTSIGVNWLFQWAFCTSAATIVSGGVAERVQSPSYALFAFISSAFIYPVLVAWTWGGGWLSDIFDVGYFDLAGSGIVHMSGGVGALAGSYILGPRSGRWDHPEEFEAHSLPLVVLGTFILWFGWFGFNPGSTMQMHDSHNATLAAQAAMNTCIGASTSAIVVFTLRYQMTKLYDVAGLCNGLLAGCVAVTAGCTNVEAGSAFVIAIVAAFVYVGSASLLVHCGIDDPVNAIPVHGFCGCWGTIAAVLFDWGKGFEYFHGWGGLYCTKGDDGACISGAVSTALAANFVLILAVFAWSGTLSAVTFYSMMKTGLLRISHPTEEMGLDAAHHSPARAYTLGDAAKSESPVEEAAKAKPEPVSVRV